jgi:hypothetical protein
MPTLQAKRKDSEILLPLDGVHDSEDRLMAAVVKAKVSSRSVVA